MSPLEFGYKDKFRTVQAQRDDSLQMFMAAVETPLKNYKYLFFVQENS